MRSWSPAALALTLGLAGCVTTGRGPMVSMARPPLAPPSPATTAVPPATPLRPETARPASAATPGPFDVLAGWSQDDHAAALGAFLRCDRGETPTDHHTLFLLQSPGGPGFNHAAFEVAHFDDLMRGHDHLKRDGRQAAWGVGRHILGSQIFDYWKDPWGHELEHWTDGDVFTAADGANIAGLDTLLGVQWGALHPMMARG